MRIPCSGAVYDNEEIDNIKDAAEEFYNVEGKYTEAFAKGLCAFLGIKYCVLCNSGSSANLLAITALNLPRGSEVITTACGFPTTLNPILQNNLVPIFADINIRTLTIDTNQIKKLISKKTKAIFVAHTLGNPSNMAEIMEIARNNNLYVVEDNCDSLGSRYKCQLTGTFGEMSTLSFYPAHHITTGEGGAVMTNRYDLYKRLMSLRNWGRDCICKPGQDNACGNRFRQQFGEMPYGYDHKYIFSNIGYNLKMTNLQAAIGVAQLKKLNKFIEIRKHNFMLLLKGLFKHGNYLAIVYSNGDPSWFGFPILCKHIDRNKIVNFLESKGIATRMLFGGNLLKQPAYKNIKYRSAELTNTDLIMKNLFWIGLYPAIGDKEIKYIIRQFNLFFRRYV